MSLVRIPFRPQFKEALLCRRKIMTCRTKRFGVPGDTFEAFGAIFLLTSVRLVALGYVAANYYAAEGCNTKGDFIEIWNLIHPVVRYQADQEVYLHEFHRVTI